MYHCPHQDISGQKDIDVYITADKDIKQEKSQRHSYDSMPCLTYRHADSHEFVMDMASVRIERAALVYYPVEEKSHDIQGRDQQYGKRIHEIVWLGILKHIILEKRDLDSQCSYHIAHSQRTRVTHEYFGPFGRCPVNIVQIERQEHPKCSHAYYSEPVLSFQYEHHGKGYHREYAQAGCQAVYSIDQIYGIDDQHYHTHSKRHSYNGRDLMYAEDSVKIVYPQSGSAQHESGNDLNRELHPV